MSVDIRQLTQDHVSRLEYLLVTYGEAFNELPAYTGNLQVEIACHNCL
jgi:hypothetical protein